MALQTSGAISLNDLHVEAGGTSGTTCSMNDSDIRGLISKGAGVGMSMNEWYGAANVFALTIASNVSNGTLSTLASNAGWNGTAPLDVTINSGVWLYSTSTSGQGLHVNVQNAIIRNYGMIIGMGGRGGDRGANGSNGGRALYIDQTGCVIYNYSGAYIAGGGGGGYGGWWGGGGGGAGGAQGGNNESNVAGGAGGGLNAYGANGPNSSVTGGNCRGGGGGGAGGGGGSYDASGPGVYGGGGGGGGRILPGSGGYGGPSSPYGYYGGAGGSAGNAGSAGYGGGHGGGGWGASGGIAAGGAAISSTQGYTLSNSGTIYGAT